MGYVSISKVHDNVGEHFVIIFEVVPFMHIVWICPRLNDEILGFGEWVVLIGYKLLTLTEPFHQRGKLHVRVPWLHEFLLIFGDFLGVDSAISVKKSVKISRMQKHARPMRVSLMPAQYIGLMAV